MDIVKNSKSKKTNRFLGLGARLRSHLGKKVRIWKYAVPIRSVMLVSVVMLSVAAIAVHFALASMNGQIDPDVALEKEIKAITAEIGKTMELPADEKPTLATVTDKGKLKSQEFFSNAQNGDKLLIFAKAKKAILFRPTTGKIIDFTNLTSGVAAGNEQSSLRQIE